MRTAERVCTDLQGRAINPGFHYAPGPSNCMFCICTDGAPKFCKPVLCSPPTDCKSFRVGVSCCEFICLDDEIKSDGGPNIDEITLRYVATPLMFILLIVFLIFFTLRMKQARNRRAQLRNNRRGLETIGYIGDSMGYMSGPCEDGPVGFPGPKYVPRGEAPPPYDEAIAQARVDALRMTPDHRNALAAQSAIENSLRHEEQPRPSSVHVYSNIPRNAIIASAQQVANQAYMFNSPLLQPVNPNTSEGRDLHGHSMMPPGPRALHTRQLPYNLPDLVRLGVKNASSGAAITFPTGSLGTITNRGLIHMINRSNNYNPSLGMQSASLHRTIPRLSTTADHEFDADPSFVRASRLQYLEMRRSFHRPTSENRPSLAENNSNSIPGNLDLTSSSSRDERRERHNPGSSAGPVQNLNLETRRSQFPLKQRNQNLVEDAERRQKGTILHLMGLFNEMLPEQHRVQIPELPLTVDRPSCMCYTNQPGDDVDADPDEYHSECENCKSANGSRWILEDGWADEAEEGTQTLQRRAPPSAAPPPATATLPQPLTKQRSNPGLSSNWDNWFNVIQDSSSSDED